MEKTPLAKDDRWLSELYSILHYQKRNVICAVVGKPGSGKSYLAMRIAECLDWAFWTASKEDAENIVKNRIVSTPTDFAKIVSEQEANLPYGSCIILDEAGIAMSYESWMSTNNKMMSHILQTFRNKRLAVFFTLPSLKFLSVQARRLLSYVIETIKIDRKNEKAICRIYKYDPNAQSGEIYRHSPKYYIDGAVVKFPRFAFSKPNPYLCAAYEARIAQFKQKVVEDVYQQMAALDAISNQGESKPIFNPKEYAEKVLEKMKKTGAERIRLAEIQAATGVSLQRARMVKTVLDEMLKKEVTK